jgi:BirA family transcriptional regulator, biotin operon repressor / biotin---[acetyl-CoA-carboxylase] ligase
MTRAALSLPTGYRLHYHETIGSTNDEAKRLARIGAPNGTLIWAREQTAGRGRRGRRWTSPPGNFYLSLVLRPETPPGRAAQLGFVAALGLGEALDQLTGTELALRFKWPNDLLANGGKIAGILLESETAPGGAVDFLVIGIGVNLASKPPAAEYPATSLVDEGLAPISSRRLVEAFAWRFDQWLWRWRSEGFAPVRQAWLARASGVGQAILVRLERTTFAGRFVDLDENGALLLEGAEGRRRVAAGDVFPALG